MTDRLRILKALRDRVSAATGPDRELDVDLACALCGFERGHDYWIRPIGRDWWSENWREIKTFTASTDVARTLFGPEWLLINLSDIAADGLSLAKFGTTETLVQEAVGIGGRTLPLTIILAKLDYEIARAEAGES